MSGGQDLPRRLGDIISPALDKLAGGDEARAYSAWARAVGDPVSRGTRPKAFRRGMLTVECASSVWANELTYLGPQILRRMDEVAPGHPVTRFRFIVGRLPDRAPRPEPSRPARDTAPGAGPAPSVAPAADRPAAPSKASAGQESGRASAKEEDRDQSRAHGLDRAPRAEAEGVQDARLRAAIEASLRRSLEEPPEAPIGGTSSG